MPAVGKTTLAEALARRFKLRYYCAGDMLKEMAIKKRYRPSGRDWWDTEEGMKFLAERAKVADFDKEVDRRLVEVVQQDNAVVTSYTLPWLVGDALKIWLKASPEKRARRMARRDRSSYQEALRIVEKRDEENKRLYSKLYDIRFGEDLSVFDFVINTEQLSSADVIEICTSIVRHFV